MLINSSEMRRREYRLPKRGKSFFSITDSVNKPTTNGQEAKVSSAIFNTIKALEKARLHFYIERTRPDTLRLNVTLVAERIEIEVFEDEHLEISRFRR